MSKLTDWLSSMDGIQQVEAVTLNIKGTTYEAAKYRFHNEEKIYILGDLPSCYQRSTKTVFRFENDTRDWYIVCCSAGSCGELYNPFGYFFMLCPWTVPSGAAIDRYNYVRGEWRPYTRVGINLVEENVAA